MLSAGSSLLDVLEAAEPDLERFMLTVRWCVEETRSEMGSFIRTELK
jgi:hypothetical protein